MSISTYLRPGTHQNGPEILGVNCGNFYILLLNSFKKYPIHRGCTKACSHHLDVQAYAFVTRKKEEALYVYFSIPPSGNVFSFYCWKIT
jgi:hypothetical protein